MDKRALFTFLLITSNLVHSEDEISVTKYKIKKGDTLSQIMEDHGIRGIYDNMIKDQHLNPMYIVAKNNGITWDQLKQLPVGKTIYLPVKSSRSVASENVLEDISQAEFKKIIDDYVKEERKKSED